MNEKRKIKLDKEKRECMIVAVKAYFLKVREEEIGHLASNMFLDFIIDDLAAEFYNQGSWTPAPT